MEASGNGCKQGSTAENRPCLNPLNLSGDGKMEFKEMIFETEGKLKSQRSFV